MNLDSARIGQLLTAVDLVYAAALDASQWKPFLGAAAALVKADNAYVSEIAHGDGTLEYVVLDTENWDSVSVGRYAALMDEDPRMPAFRQSPYRPLHCRMVVPEMQLRQSRVYLEALKPLDIEYTLVVGVPAGHGVTNFLGFTRKAVSPGFNTEDCELVGELVPHLGACFHGAPCAQPRAVIIRAAAGVAVARRTEREDARADICAVAGAGAADRVVDGRPHDQGDRIDPRDHRG